jgi:hypothetical protein
MAFVLVKGANGVEISVSTYNIKVLKNCNIYKGIIINLGVS